MRMQLYGHESSIIQAAGESPAVCPFPVLCQQDLRRPSHSCAGRFFFEASNEAQHRHQVVVPADAFAARSRHPVLAAA